jgi:hypothetical protein
MGDARGGEVTRQQKNLGSFLQRNLREGRFLIFHGERWKIANESKIFNQTPLANRPKRRIYLPISSFSTAHSNQPLLQLLQTERLLAFVLQICPSFESLSSYY